MDELISRQAAQHKVNALIDEFETIMKDIRERHVDDSVCGLCEYDGAFMSDSGTWCNECPGFERDDCFKLKDQYREEWAGAIKNLPPVQPKHEIKATLSKTETVGDAISRQAAIYIASGFCHPANVAKELAKLPPVRPTQEIIHCEQCANHNMCALEERTEHQIMFCGLADKRGDAE